MFLCVLAISSVGANYYSEEKKEQTTGVFYDWGANKGYNLFYLTEGIGSYIVDNDGKEKHRW